MGRLYGFGHGVRKDYEVEASWYRLAVAQDHPIAAYNGADIDNRERLFMSYG